MADQFTTTTTTGYGRRIVNSIGGVIFGILLFFASFLVLYLNEGRVDLSSIAKTAVEINSASVSSDSSLNGKLVSVTGVVSTSENIGDKEGMFFTGGNYIAVKRLAEMYAWKETKNTTSTNNTGGSSTTNTTYSYTKEWTESPADSSNFQHPDGHQNPQKIYNDAANYATTATVGAYDFNPSAVTLPSFIKIQLTPQNTKNLAENYINPEGYIYIRSNKLNTTGTADIGDMRISYYVLAPGFTGTIFGAYDGNSIETFVNQNNVQLYRLFAGTRAQGIATMHSEYELWLWIVRGIGFFMMWIGLMLLFGPIITILDILPILGGITGALIGIVILPVAILLTAVTILISIIIHSVVALIITLAVTVAAIVAVLIFVRERKKISA